MDMPHILEFFRWLGYNLGLLAAGVALALLAHFIVVQIMLKLAKRTTTQFDEITVIRCGPPMRWIAVAAAVWLTLDLTTLSPGLEEFLRHLVSVALICLIAWLLIRSFRIARDVFLGRYKINVADNLRARAIHTQVKVLERIVITVVFVIALGCIMMTFDGVKQLGASLLASAGIVGLILGLAAQKVIGTLFAGFQLAITQPIRIDDVVIVEGEWGVIEEITLTYIIVRIWDLRRLVVPTSYFMERPFQNWTRVSADLLGTVFIPLDVATPVEPIRQELHRLLKESPLWDNKAWCLQVTNVTERTMELRALMSAANASATWDLRCQIREKLLDFVKSHFPDALPRLRIERRRATPGNDGTPSVDVTGPAMS